MGYIQLPTVWLEACYIFDCEPQYGSGCHIEICLREHKGEHIREGSFVLGNRAVHGGFSILSYEGVEHDAVLAITTTGLRSRPLVHTCSADAGS